MAQFDVYKFEMLFQLGPVKVSTAWFYRQADPDVSTGREIATFLGPQLVQILWTDMLKVFSSVNMSMIETRCQLYAPTKDRPDIIIDAPSFGSKVGNRLSNSDAVVVTKYPTSWTPNFICRNYYPGWDEDEFTGSRMQAALLTAAQSTINAQELTTAIITSPETLEFDQVCFSQTLWKAFDPLTQVITDVYSVMSAAQVQPVLGTQRRRRPPRGAGPAA